MRSSCRPPVRQIESPYSAGGLKSRYIQQRLRAGCFPRAICNTHIFALVMMLQIRRNIDARPLICGVLLLAIACSSGNEQRASISDSGRVTTKDAPVRAAAIDESAAARNFVETFYKWYVPVANGKHRDAAWYTVLDQRPNVLSDTLLRALRHDREEQAKAVGEIAGLDFDPFLSGQDPCARYVTGDSVQHGKTYRVPVFGICGSVKHSQPDVVAEVSRRDSSWVFVDFHYPGADGAHLLSILSSTDSAGSPK